MGVLLLLWLKIATILVLQGDVNNLVLGGYKLKLIPVLQGDYQLCQRF